jgi:hypothetical protein
LLSAEVRLLETAFVIADRNTHQNSTQVFATQDALTLKTALLNTYKHIINQYSETALASVVIHNLENHFLILTGTVHGTC